MPLSTESTTDSRGKEKEKEKGKEAVNGSAAVSKEDGKRKVEEVVVAPTVAAVRELIDKLATFAAERAETDVVSMLRRKEASNSRFGFLQPTHEHYPYFAQQLAARTHEVYRCCSSSSSSSSSSSAVLLRFFS